MKKITFALLAFLFLLASCGKKSEDGHHTHEDGTTHADHGSDTTKQEEFNVSDTTGHHHDTEHQHPHPH
jgi:hypothetical protein